MRERTRRIDRGNFAGIFAGLALLGALGCRRESAPPEPARKATAPAASVASAGAPSGAASAAVVAPPLPSASAAASASAATSASAAASASAAPSDELPSSTEPANHRVGPLALGLSEKDVAAALGAPKKKSKPIVEEATGSTIAVWSYPERGLSVTFARADEKEPWRIERFTAEAPSVLRTNRDIGIGSARKDVERAYAGKFAEDAPPTEERLVIDSIYGGVLFTFDRGKVASIFVGAAAE